MRGGCYSLSHGVGLGLWGVNGRVVVVSSSCGSCGSYGG